MECARARFDGHGGLLNADEAIGEIVDRDAGARLRGVLRQRRGDRASASATVGTGRGDLGYRDEDGWF